MAITANRLLQGPLRSGAARRRSWPLNSNVLRATRDPAVSCTAYV